MTTYNTFFFPPFFLSLLIIYASMMSQLQTESVRYYKEGTMHARTKNTICFCIYQLCFILGTVVASSASTRMVLLF